MICLGFGDSSWGKYWIRGGEKPFLVLPICWPYGGMVTPGGFNLKLSPKKFISSSLVTWESVFRHIFDLSSHS